MAQLMPMPFSQNPFNGIPVYRFFRNEPEAQALLNGNVWISTLARCRAHETALQGDREEGWLKYLSGTAVGDGSDPVFRELAARAGIVINPEAKNFRIANNLLIEMYDAYVICTSERFNPKYFATLNLPYGVEITDSGEFCRRVSRAMGEKYKVHGINTDMQACKYLGREVRGLDARHGPAAFLKPVDAYTEQREIRMSWIAYEIPRFEPFPLRVPDVAELCRRRW